MSNTTVWITAEEAAAAWRVSVATIRRLIASGRLPAVKIGRSVRIDREQLQDVEVIERGIGAVGDAIRGRTVIVAGKHPKNAKSGSEVTHG
jgi:excisionase family DNA binding protein